MCLLKAKGKSTFASLPVRGWDGVRNGMGLEVRYRLRLVTFTYILGYGLFRNIQDASTRK